MHLLCSILDDIDDILKEGDVAVDPFNRLNIVQVSMKSDPSVLFTYLMSYLDIDELRNVTGHIDIEAHAHALAVPGYVLLHDEFSEVIIRFIAWSCNKMLHRESHLVKNISLNEILLDKSLNKLLNFYIYKTYRPGYNRDVWSLELRITNGPGLEVLFTNTDSL